MPTRNVVLTERHAKLVESLVAKGRYQNASEVLREGLRLIEVRDAEDEARIAALRAAVKQGQADLAAGRFKEFASVDELTSHLRKRAERAVRK